MGYELFFNNIDFCLRIFYNNVDFYLIIFYKIKLVYRVSTNKEISH